MSWTGIKKAINRAGTQVMMKTGQIDETVDKQFEFEEKRFKLMESNSIKLHKELKHYLESLRILTNSQVNVANVLKNFYGEEDLIEERELINQGKEIHYNNFSNEYYKTIKNLNDEILNNLESPYNQVILNPIARFNSYFIEINEAIKKRNNKKLDYDLMKSKLQKLIENPPSTSNTLASTLSSITTNLKPNGGVNDNGNGNGNGGNSSESIEKDFEDKLSNTKLELSKTQEYFDKLNDNLKSELPKLINLRIPFLNPSFESFIKLQLRFFNENYSTLDNLQSKLDSQVRQDYINGNLESRLDNVLVKMRELNITGGH